MVAGSLRQFPIKRESYAKFEIRFDVKFMPSQDLVDGIEVRVSYSRFFARDDYAREPTEFIDYVRCNILMFDEDGCERELGSARFSLYRISEAEDHGYPVRDLFDASCDEDLELFKTFRGMIEREFSPVPLVIVLDQIDLNLRDETGVRALFILWMKKSYPDAYYIFANAFPWGNYESLGFQNLTPSSPFV